MRTPVTLTCALAFMVMLAIPTAAQESEDDKPPALNSALVSGLKLRNIGPALMSGRIVEIAVDPVKRSTWYLAVASGGVWKTTNAGVTWEPIFDKQTAYSVGTVVVDPNDHLTVWVGTGENNSQRSVGYGDGVYKSVDGGASFANVGLKASEHIARILIDPRNSKVVYVASQGPLWAPGGDRGLYKTADGGKTWDKVLEIDEHTGVSDVVFHPTNPDVLYASAYQRRRHVWTLINGGPGSGIHKSTDAGATWKKINRGLPSGDKGRIGLAISSQNPDVVYAIVEAAGDAGGFFRSEDGGEHWKRQSRYVSGSPQYYQEIYADPHKFDRIYSLDTYMMVSEDGGKTFERLGEQWKHVDNHALYVDPDDPDHLIIGCDGGLYETFDRGQSYRFFPNLPLTQFYKVAVDNASPFYNVYGGTQDNNTQGGPSRTDNVHGIRNSDWFITVGGDGFDAAVDPEDENIVYSQWQYGGLVRFDRRTGEEIDIRPQEAKEGPPLRWNWDSALLISPHAHTRIYFAAQILFRSDDRGDTWRAVSPDLTRNMDRNRLPVMGRVWGVDAVAKNASTSFYGTIVALTESPSVEGLLYAGTDDGLIQVTEDGGQTWRKIDGVRGVPEMTYVNDLEASLHDPNTAFAVFNNHKRGDFKPYVFKSVDRGRSWTSITGDLPERGSTYTVVQDHVNPNLLFVGTEFGVFFTVDGGAKWIQLKGGMPTIAIRELEIQRRENDLVAASFGRGFFVLDDYTPLREVSDALLQQTAKIFPVKTAQWYAQANPLGGGEKASQGADFFTAPNPPYGATFTYYRKEPLKTRKAERQAQEAKLVKESKDVFYPSWDDLRAEDREEKPAVTLTIRDQDDAVVRRIEGSTAAGIHRATWDLRYPGFTTQRSGRGGRGPMAVPGRYTVSVEQWVDGAVSELAPPTPFEVEPLGLGSLPAPDRAAVLAFQQQTGALQRAVMGTNAAASEAADRLSGLKEAVESWPGADPALRMEARTLELRLMDLREKLTGDQTRADRNEPEMPGLMRRLQGVIGGHWSTTYGPTATHRRNYEIAAEEFGAIYDQLKQVIEVALPALEQRIEATGAPIELKYRLPVWRP
ncbi:MAG: glycosyl hydrolase [Gemmatimonadota bacterium]|nr:glycosyl hydrolase [Gemmatimonadota bacterium]MDH3368435.1 glycosyl hydrolase [Gemmatimonadota bacterium]MDH3477343.1 glycosyl hydrolase [Gemmatimonadota bacterium]MDH5549659.1 glycosyl hydrolase [Gemmatimonadota bacterium]